MSFFLMNGRRYGDQFEHECERIERIADGWEREMLYGHMKDTTIQS